MKCLLVYITTSSIEESRKIAGIMIEKKLAACANILSGMESCYVWNGEVVNDQESVLILKTTEILFDELTTAVKQEHSYEVPCIIGFPIEHGSDEYLKWIADSVKKTNDFS